MTASTRPLISVITPSFNRGAWVGDAVRSVLAQTVREIEHVVVDDGSTDGTFEVLQELAASDDRVQVARQENRGPSAARNRALSMATGTYVTFLDSDDLLPPDRLEKQLRYLEEHPDADAVFGTQELVPAPGIETPDREHWASGRPQHCWSTMLVLRSQILDVGAFDEELWDGEDTDLSFRLRGRGLQLDAVDDVYLLRRFIGDNLTYSTNDPTPTLLASVRRHLRRRQADST